MTKFYAIFEGLSNSCFPHNFSLSDGNKKATPINWGGKLALKALGFFAGCVFFGWSCWLVVETLL